MTDTYIICLAMEEEFERAQDEWDKVAEIVPSVQQVNQARTPNGSADTYRETPLVTIEPVLRDFREKYLERLLENEDQAIPLRDSGRNFRLNRLRSFLRCPSSLCNPSLRGMLLDEKQEIMATSRCSFDDENRIHFDVLLTLYKQLVKLKFN